MPLDSFYRYCVNMVNFFDVIIIHQRQCCQSKVRMKDVNFIPWSIRDDSGFGVLAPEDIILECLEVNPVLPVNHEASRKDPP